MDVAYIFSEPGRLRIPLSGGDNRFFPFFHASGGIWDKSRGEFVFDGDFNAGQFVDSLGIPLVLIKDQPSAVKVFGFFERPWDKSGFACQRQVKHSAPAAPALPDRFSDQWVLKLENELRSRKYSRRTIDAYIYFNRLLCKNLQKTPEEIQTGDIKQFLAEIEKDRNYSASSLNLAISSMKFFYKTVIQKDILREQHRPRQDKRLPVVLSKDEIKKIFMKEKNYKHSLLLMMVYASGLRVSEVVCLKKQDIDISRKLINIRAAKGRKDRYTIVSDTVINVLTDYYSRYDISGWLFCGYNPDKHISIRSAQYIFENALKEAKIDKPASIHSLRHSFATHLLEAGTDIRYIQELLGHTSVRTTERYTHVAKRKTLAITSPLDTIGYQEEKQ